MTSGRTSRNKGAQGERELSKILNEQYGLETHRGYVQFKQSDLIGIPGIHPEVKRVENLNIHKAYAQAVAEAEKREDGEPVVFHRRSREPWMVTMSLDTFMKYYREV